MIATFMLSPMIGPSLHEGDTLIIISNNGSQLVQGLRFDDGLRVWFPAIYPGEGKARKSHQLTVSASSEAS